MTINYTTLLGLAEPVTGTESGTWGDDVNLGITLYLDIAIAGTNNITQDSDITLTTTNGSSAGSNIVASPNSTTAQYMQLLCTGARTANRNINAPNSSKMYVVNNSTTGGYSITIRGTTGPTTGVTIANGEKAIVFWSSVASDFVKISSSSVFGAITASSITDSGLTSGRVTYAGTGGLLQDSSSLQFDGTNLSVGAAPVSGKGSLQVGTIGYTDTGVVAAFSSSVAGYNQLILQNTNSGSTASANLNISNNNATSTTNFGEFGINSSGFTGTGAFNQAGYVYLASASTDLAIGTYGSNAIHFVVNSGATDAMTVATTGIVSFPTTGAITLPNGTTGQQPASPASGMLRFNTTTTQFEGYNGTAWSSVGGAAISNDTTTSTNIYPISASATSGTALTVYTSNAKFLYKPSTGELTSPEVIASNGIFVNSQTVSTSYTIATGNSAMSAGPITVASGQSVTISSGSRWVVL